MAIRRVQIRYGIEPYDFQNSKVEIFKDFLTQGRRILNKLNGC